MDENIELRTEALLISNLHNLDIINNRNCYTIMPKNDMDKSKDNLEIEKKDICSETKLGTIHSKLDS